MSPGCQSSGIQKMSVPPLLCISDSAQFASDRHTTLTGRTHQIVDARHRSRKLLLLRGVLTQVLPDIHVSACHIAQPQVRWHPVREKAGQQFAPWSVTVFHVMARERPAIQHAFAFAIEPCQFNAAVKLEHQWDLIRPCLFNPKVMLELAQCASKLRAGKRAVTPHAVGVVLTKHRRHRIVPERDLAGGFIIATHDKPIVHG